MFDIIGSICVGDKTSRGCTVITGSPSTDVNGRAIARTGDRIACKRRCVIVTGNPTEIIDGAPMALHGSQTSGGCICLSGNHGIHGDGLSPAAAAAIPAAADAGIAFMPETAEALHEDHWVEFRLMDADNQAIPHLRYIVTDPTGATISGHLDEAGFARVSPVKAGVCRIELPEVGYTTSVESCPP